MLCLGIDPSLTGFGWAIHEDETTGPGRLVSSGLWITSPEDVFVVRYFTLRHNLQQLLEANPEIRYVGVESPPYGEQFSEGLYALFTHVNEAVYIARRDVVHFDPGTVKMLAKIDPKIQVGKMTKQDMIRMAALDTGIAKWNHNIADAYLIGVYAARFWRFQRGELPQTDLTPSEYRAFAKTHVYTRGKKKGLEEKTGAVFKEGRRFFQFSLLPTQEKV